MTSAAGLYSKQKKGYTIIGLPAVITRENVLHIENRIGAIITQTKKPVILDISTVRDIFSILITLIVHIKNQVFDSGETLYLINVNDNCLAQLKSMNLHKVLPIYKNEAAVKEIL